MKKTITLSLTLSLFLLASITNILAKKDICQEEALDINSESKGETSSESLESLIKQQSANNTKSKKDNFLKKIGTIQQTQDKLDSEQASTDYQITEQTAAKPAESCKWPGKATSFLIGMGVGIAGVIGTLIFW